MSDFLKFRRKQIAELRDVTKHDIDSQEDGFMLFEHKGSLVRISITSADVASGSPKIGDKIARNPKNHGDQWLVAKRYFEENFEPI